MCKYIIIFAFVLFACEEEQGDAEYQVVDFPYCTDSICWSDPICLDEASTSELAEEICESSGGRVPTTSEYSNKGTDVENAIIHTVCPIPDGMEDQQMAICVIDI